MIFRKTNIKRGEIYSNQPKESEATEKSLELSAVISEQANGYVTPDSELKRKREKNRFLIYSVILLILGISLCLLNPIFKNMNTTMMLVGPLNLMRTYLLPIFWLLLGVTLMQGAGVLGMVKRLKVKASRPIYIAMLAILLLYAAIMLPNVIIMVKLSFVELQYMHNPSLFPDGICVTSPLMSSLIMGITQRMMDVVYSKPIMFAIPGVILWLSGADKQKRRHKT